MRQQRSVSHHPLQQNPASGAGFLCVIVGDIPSSRKLYYRALLVSP
jgi:hypothetical protein